MGTVVLATYGKVRSPEKAWDPVGRTLAADGGLWRGVAVIRDGTDAFRLNSPGWLTTPPELVRTLRDRRALRLLCLDGALSMTAAFSAAARNTIKRYFAYLEDDLPLGGEETVELEEPSDRFFAALLPLSGAKLLVVDEGSREILAEPMIAGADLIFWTGRRLEMIRFGDVSSATPQVRAALDTLAERSPVPLRLHWAPTSRSASLEEILPGEVLVAHRSARQPWYGPYRVNSFREPLPRRERSEALS